MLFIYLFYYPYSQFVGRKNVYTHSLKKWEYMGDIELVFDPYSVILIEELYAVSHCSLTLLIIKVLFVLNYIYPQITSF